MKYAIIDNGGKQYRAVEGSTIEVDRMNIEVGQQIDLGSVLLLVDGDNIDVGVPLVGGVRVSATVVEHVKGPKLIIFRYRPKKRYRVKTGHRQQYTRLQVNSIVVEGKEENSETPSKE
jgi:large subunit ribosomal protein L21